MWEWFVKWLVKRKWKREHPCNECEYLLAVGNHSLCYSCRNNNNFLKMSKEVSEFWERKMDK